MAARGHSQFLLCTYKKTLKILPETRGKFNKASALGRSLYWCQALQIMNIERYQSTSARRALALLNSPQWSLVGGPLQK